MLSLGEMGGKERSEKVCIWKLVDVGREHTKSSAKINKRKRTKVTKLASTCVASKASTSNNPEMTTSLSGFSITKMQTDQVSLAVHAQRC
jgi:hypothetical protein